MVEYIEKKKREKKKRLYKKLKEWNKNYKKNEKKVIKDIKKHKKLLNALTHEEFLEHALRAKYGDDVAIAIGGSRKYNFKAKPPKNKKKFPDLDIAIFLPKNRKSTTEFPEIDNPLLSYLTLTKLGLAEKREKYAGIKEKIKGRTFLDLHAVYKEMPEIPHVTCDEDTSIVKNLARKELKAIRDKPFVKAWEKAEKSRAIVDVITDLTNANKPISLEEIAKNWGKTIKYHQYDSFNTVMTEEERKKLPKMQEKAAKEVEKKDLEGIINHLTDMGALEEKNGKYSVSKKYWNDWYKIFDADQVMKDYWEEIKPGKRIIIKLGGGLIAPKKRRLRGLDKKTFRNLMDDIKELHEDGYEIGLTVGGGKYGHRAVKEEKGVQKFMKLRAKMYDVEAEIKKLDLQRMGKNENTEAITKKIAEKHKEINDYKKQIARVVEENDNFHEATKRINKQIEKLHALTAKEAEKVGLKIERVVTPHNTYRDSEKEEYIIKPETLVKVGKKLEDEKSIPTAYGSVIPKIPEDELGMVYKIGSADAFTKVLAKETDADKVLFVTDVDGVYTKNPKDHKDAERIGRGTIDDILQKVKDTEIKNIDVTGAMRGKLAHTGDITKEGIPVHIISGKKKGSIMKALSGEYIGTRIIPEKKKKK